MLCSCGREHKLQIQVKLGPDALTGLDQLSGLGQVALIADENTWPLAGERIIGLLDQVGVRAIPQVFPGAMVPDERALGALMLRLQAGNQALIALGSGSLTDLVRFTATRLGLPYLVVPTAPSMDGYASSVAALTLEGVKTTYDAKPPLAILADPGIFGTAPLRLIQAGFGDLMGKVTAKADWLLAHQVLHEYHCPYVQGLVDQVVGDCQALAFSDPLGPGFSLSLMEGLVRSGTAISMVGSSRPASGSEHHLAHYWEMRGVQLYHGEKVGIATDLILQLYQKVGERLEPEDPLGQILANLPSLDQYRSYLAQVGMSSDYREYGISTQLVREALLQGMYVRERFTVLRYAHQRGWLDQMVQEML